MHTTVEKVTRRIVERSRQHREAYLERAEAARGQGVFRQKLACSNLAHDLAGCTGGCAALMDENVPNIGMISSYNDILSAHQPYRGVTERRN